MDYLEQFMDFDEFSEPEIMSKPVSERGFKDKREEVCIYTCGYVHTYMYYTHTYILFICIYIYIYTCSIYTYIYIYK
jgi:hypothetical protein